jgi:hypothetical protein
MCKTESTVRQGWNNVVSRVSKLQDGRSFPGTANRNSVLQNVHIESRKHTALDSKGVAETPWELQLIGCRADNVTLSTAEDKALWNDNSTPHALFRRKQFKI